MVQKRLGWEWSRFRMGSEIQKPSRLKSGQMTTILSKNYLKSGLKYPDFEWSGFRMVRAIVVAIAKAWPFEIQSSKSPDLRSPLYLFNGLFMNKLTHTFIFSNPSRPLCSNSYILALLKSKPPHLTLFMSSPNLFQSRKDILKLRFMNLKQIKSTILFSGNPNPRHLN